MLDEIESPSAYGVVTWRTAAEGGRVSGPPTAPVYAATCAFVVDGEVEEVQLSILLQPVADNGRVAVGFMATELARPKLRVGGRVQVLEGPKVVGDVILTEITATDQPG
ncbi:hypothetical protein [Actinokineospora pegani]|uniref:hypothetical protein n=1 Tax=Actinokineospora pegani TaxID=2654637 RepID=UPI0012EA39D3|nr:hypothetical protein [Actinokineospora pegani]